jgi:4-aminobutyrate aminotransferase-like enzyme
VIAAVEEQRLMKAANANGLILLACGTYGNVIRFLVPLTASDEMVHEGMDLFANSPRLSVSLRRRLSHGKPAAGA